MVEQSNVHIVRAYFEGINAHSAQNMAQWLDDEFTVEVATGATCPMDKQKFLAYNKNYMNAFPDVQFKATLFVSEGDYVVAHWKASGTQTKALTTQHGGIIMPTNRTATADGSFTFEIRNGKIRRMWVIWDMATLLAQLGLLTAP